MVKLNWTKIRNEYINGHISYRKLAAKHNISESTLMQRAVKEKWADKRKEQRSKIDAKTEQKTAEKIAEQESDLAANINSAANELLEKLKSAIEQTDLYIERTTTKVPKKVRDKTSGEVFTAWQQEENIRLEKKEGINLDSTLKIANALKTLQTILPIKSKDDTPQEEAPTSIIFEAATVEDMAGEEE